MYVKHQGLVTLCNTVTSSHAFRAIKSIHVITWHKMLSYACMLLNSKCYFSHATAELNKDCTQNIRAISFDI